MFLRMLLSLSIFKFSTCLCMFRLLLFFFSIGLVKINFVFIFFVFDMFLHTSYCFTHVRCWVLMSILIYCIVVIYVLFISYIFLFIGLQSHHSSYLSGESRNYIVHLFLFIFISLGFFVTIITSYLRDTQVGNIVLFSVMDE